MSISFPFLRKVAENICDFGRALLFVFSRLLRGQFAGGAAAGGRGVGGGRSSIIGMSLWREWRECCTLTMTIICERAINRTERC